MINTGQNMEEISAISHLKMFEQWVDHNAYSAGTVYFWLLKTV